MNHQFKREAILSNLNESLANSVQEGLLIVDTCGIIRLCNTFFSAVLNQDISAIEGQALKSVIPNCGLMGMIRSPLSYWGEALTINSHELFINKMPYYVDGVLVGAIIKTTFPTAEKAHHFAQSMSLRKQHPVDMRLHTCMDIIGETEPMLRVKKMARKASISISNLLITGESGTGKTILVEAIHNRSSRKAGPFVKVNCAAIPENLLESELFGYEPGAFTGSNRNGKRGKFEVANGGTLFLDEIGDMSLYMQAKILQAIQDRRIERVGGNDSIYLDVRIVAATNRNLKEMVKAGTFREDLYYRLKVLEIHMPAIREIKEDIPRYAEGLLGRIAIKLGTKHQGFTESSMTQMMAYDWPGNVRQLENFIEQAANFSPDNLIDVNLLNKVPWTREFKAENIVEIRSTQPTDLNQMIDTAEREVIISAIENCGGNKSKAAEFLNLNRTVLYKKMKRLGISL